MSMTKTKATRVLDKKDCTSDSLEKSPAKKKSSREIMLARVESVRLAQREENHFDCFGRAAAGFCDQSGCTFHSECLSISRLVNEI